MSDQPTNQSWAAALATYDAIVSPSWPHMPAFRAFVAELGCTEEASGLTAITSHDTLIVSPYTRHPDWIEGRHVLFRPHKDGRVLIESYPQGWNAAPTESRFVAMADALAVARRAIADL